MKKEELSTALLSALGTNSNLSERTVSAYAEQTASVMGEEYEMTDDFVQKHVAVLKSIGGQLSHDISAGIETWKANNKPEPTPPAPPAPPSGNTELDELKKQLDSLKTQIAESNSQKTMEAYRKELRDKLKEKLGSGANDYILEDVVKGEWDTNKGVETIIGEAESAYNAKYKKCFGTGPAPRTPQGNAETSKAMTAKKNAFMEKLRSEGKLPPKEKQ